MFLTRKEILAEIKKGNIKIEPFDRKALGPISFDLSLGDEFGLLKKKRIKLDEEVNYKEHIKVVRSKEIELKPNDFVLGITRERITLAENIAGLLSGRSKFARLGLLVHATAPLIHPGVSNKQIFEIKNVGNAKLILSAGLRIGQLSFIRLSGKEKYSGIFSKQEKIK